ncbi:VanZ family protein [Rossellomorea aquimaris]|uniref:VanZ family protein n=1 Tax=Rossellomorea aquimaris TaxID=189382 RepID=UPI001CD1CC02|nr:VanZ family protein [Rossellomorea aquimaris]MCA1053662.1 VanZ family protein [Rossellomorea aquimaris]
MHELWSAFGWVIPIIALTTITSILAASIWKRKKGKGRWMNLLPVLLLSISIGGICLITLSPFIGEGGASGAGQGQTNMDPFSNLKLNLLYRNHLDVPIRNLLANIVLFIPFAFFSSWWMRHQRAVVLKATFLGALFSFFIELTQYFLPLGRSTDIDDWLMNTLGSLIGGILFVIAAFIYRVWKLNNR